jgi:hypothetical protein
MAKRKIIPIIQNWKNLPGNLKWFYQDRNFSLVKIKRKADVDMIFTGKTDWQLYFRLFLSRIDAWDWSRWLFSWIFEVYEKDGGRKTERIGIAVLRFSDEQVLKDMENVILLSFIFGSMKTHPQPSQEGS